MSEQRRRVIFLNRFFYPDHAPTAELLSDVAFALAERGFDVSVITSRQSYEKADAELPSRERSEASTSPGCGPRGAAGCACKVEASTT